jgi:membrane associated rhomboid family serine protease
MTQFRPTGFGVLPTVIKNLLIINGLVFLAQNTLTGSALSFSFEDTFALHAYQSSLFKPWQLITHMFMHGSLGHIFGNMLALWMFGAILENIWGPKQFLLFYFLCGLGAAFLHLGITSYELMHASEMYYQSRVDIATLGASGAVFGILIAFVYLFPNTYIYIYFFIPMKAKWLGIIYFSFELITALQNAPGDGVARWAHVGGAVVGFILVFIWKKNNRRYNF